MKHFVLDLQAIRKLLPGGAECTDKELRSFFDFCATTHLQPRPDQIRCLFIDPVSGNSEKGAEQ